MLRIENLKGNTCAHRPCPLSRASDACWSKNARPAAPSAEAQALNTLLFLSALVPDSRGSGNTERFPQLCNLLRARSIGGFCYMVLHCDLVYRKMHIVPGRTFSTDDCLSDLDCWTPCFRHVTCTKRKEKIDSSYSRRYGMVTRVRAPTSAVRDVCAKFCQFLRLLCQVKACDGTCTVGQAGRVYPCFRLWVHLTDDSWKGALRVNPGFHSASPPPPPVYQEGYVNSLSNLERIEGNKEMADRKQSMRWGSSQPRDCEDGTAALLASIRGSFFFSLVRFSNGLRTSEETSVRLGAGVTRRRKQGEKALEAKLSIPWNYMRF